MVDEVGCDLGFRFCECVGVGVEVCIFVDFVVVLYDWDW